MIAKRASALLTPYARIVKNATEGKGVVLTVDEVFHMGTIDDAVETVGTADLEAAGWAFDVEQRRWRKVRLPSEE